MDDLEKFLRQYDVPIHSWGKNGNKSLDELRAEILDGESKLIQNGGGLVRVVRPLAVDVFYSDGKNIFLLREDRQVFLNGKVRRRDLDVSLAEKLKGGEIPNKESLLRALKEELGIEGVSFCRQCHSRFFEELHRDGFGYSGMLTRYFVYYWLVGIRKKDFRPDGYVEVQPGRKSTYFVWEKSTFFP